jgi:ATP-dependent helicase YprA (DUF1998 family)
VAGVVCKDCLTDGVTTPRPTPHGGPRSPRCVTHHRARRRRQRARSHELRTQANYGLTADQYGAIYEYQGRRCYICQRATGATKRLAVDHDHDRCDDHAPETGCPDCVRALLCGPCNQIIGRLGVAALRRAIVVLTEPPAQRVLFGLG